MPSRASTLRCSDRLSSRWRCWGKGSARRARSLDFTSTTESVGAEKTTKLGMYRKDKSRASYLSLSSCLGPRQEKQWHAREGCVPSPPRQGAALVSAWSISLNQCTVSGAPNLSVDPHRDREALADTPIVVHTVTTLVSARRMTSPSLLLLTTDVLSNLTPLRPGLCFIEISLLLVRLSVPDGGLTRSLVLSLPLSCPALCIDSVLHCIHTALGYWTDIHLRARILLTPLGLGTRAGSRHD